MLSRAILLIITPTTNPQRLRSSLGTLFVDRPSRRPRGVDVDTRAVDERKNLIRLAETIGRLRPDIECWFTETQ
jgi:hypothetical protein